MGTSPLNKIQKIDRMQQVLALSRQGLSQREIGAEMGISHGSVSKLLAEGLGEVARELYSDKAQHLALAVDRCEYLYRNAIKQAVGGPVLDENGEPALRKNGVPIIAEPNHHWQKAALSALQHKHKLLGLAPDGITVVNVGGNPNGGTAAVSLTLGNLNATELSVLEFLILKCGGNVSLVVKKDEAEGDYIDADVVENEG